MHAWQGLTELSLPWRAVFTQQGSLRASVGYRSLGLLLVVNFQRILLTAMVFNGGSSDVKNTCTSAQAGSATAST